MTPISNLERPYDFFSWPSLVTLLLLPLLGAVALCWGRCQGKRAEEPRPAKRPGRKNNKKARAGREANSQAKPAEEEEEGKVPETEQALPEGHVAGFQDSVIDAAAANLPLEQRRTLLKLRRKLREIAKIESLLEGGVPVEENQLRKVDTKQELVADVKTLLMLAGAYQVPDDNGFLLVGPSTVQNRLRSEVAAPQEPAVSHAVGAESAEQQRRSRPKGSRKKAAQKSDDDSKDWVQVTAAKQKKTALTEDEKVARDAALEKRESQRVQSTQSVEYERTRESLKSFQLLDESTCTQVEELIDQVVVDAEKGLLKEKSVDLTAMRNKYFFGFAYTYGAQREHPGAKGIEAVWPPSETEPVPQWIKEMLIVPLEKRGIVPKGWINSATINDYAAGGCIVSHIDPPHLFDRPIIGVNFFSDCNLVFGTSFSFPKEAVAGISCSTPIYVHACQRGHVNILKGYSANSITHAIRPCDLPTRRASIILRRVLQTAPVLLQSLGTTVAVKDLPPEYCRNETKSQSSNVSKPSALRKDQQGELRHSKHFETGVLYNVLKESTLTSSLLQDVLTKILKRSTGSAFRHFAGRGILDFKLAGTGTVELGMPFQDLNPLLAVMAAMAKQSLGRGEELALLQIVINCFRDGDCEVKPHRHRCRQICVSLGATREVEVDGRRLTMGSGDALLLDGELHSVPPASKAGQRISICLFYGSLLEYRAQAISVNAGERGFGGSIWWTHPDDMDTGTG
eukprot:TRINITY_DN61233_c0_g1_i1.p1 TRINITY_DN61233_c0_g1~~TRINITY_DN61233_c0_g1_i1.p1  ORF type:complete len:739 (+),score=156.26 TRINITY_DN61233_c0_g1_i1:57-2273(+)